MKKIIFIIGSLLVLDVLLGCGSVDSGGEASLPSYWVKSYGGSVHDEAHSIQQTSDGGYIQFLHHQLLWTPTQPLPGRHHQYQDLHMWLW